MNWCAVGATNMCSKFKFKMPLSMVSNGSNDGGTQCMEGWRRY